MTDLSVIIPEVKGAREYTKSEMRAAVIDSTVAFMARSQGGIEHIKDLFLDADDHWDKRKTWAEKTKLKDVASSISCPIAVAAWLASQPGLEIVARDRGGSYARAAAQGASQAQQVADRWHLMENASAAFLSACAGP